MLSTTPSHESGLEVGDGEGSSVVGDNVGPLVGDIDIVGLFVNTTPRPWRYKSKICA